MEIFWNSYDNLRDFGVADLPVAKTCNLIPSSPCLTYFNFPISLLDIPGIGSRTYSVNDQASYKRISSYGSIPTRGSSYAQSRSFPSPHVRGTTPPMLFSSAGSNPYKPVEELD